jgi:tRNA-Thr(GGU) m(6)t(6)A37 methyltransferase TsaA
MNEPANLEPETNGAQRFRYRRRIALWATLIPGLVRFVQGDEASRAPELRLKPIGVIRTPFLEPAGTPIQPSRADGARGTVHVAGQFCRGLRDLEGFERVWLIYWLHKSREVSLLVTPFLDREQRGLFATRSPARPAPLGISAVRLIAIQENLLEVADVDMIDGTPLLDIKPYVPEFDSYPGSRAGWFDKSHLPSRRADDRFAPHRGKP